MCPCKVCFPGDEECIGTCANNYVSCPLLDEAAGRHVLDHCAKSNGDCTEATQNDEQQQPLNILEQPTNLVTLTNRYTDKAIEFIRDSIHYEKPFFLYLAYHHTHFPQFAGLSFVLLMCKMFNKCIFIHIASNQYTHASNIHVFFL